MEFHTGQDDIGRRLDRICRKILPEIGLGAIYTAIRKGGIRVNHEKREQSYKIEKGDIIVVAQHLLMGRRDEIHLPPLTLEVKKALDGAILLENDFFVIFNKPAGILSHGDDSVKSYLDHLYEKVKQRSLAFSPAPLHRLDRNTSGILVCGTSIAGASGFSDLIRRKALRKVYLGIHKGEIIGTPEWRDRIERSSLNKRSYSSETGKEALLHCIPLINSSGCTMTLLLPQTGLTHQIRVQAALHGHPLIGDHKYGDKVHRKSSYFLHAVMLFFPSDSPLGGVSAVFAPLPAGFKAKLEELFPVAEVAAIISGLPGIIKEKTASI